MGITTLRRLYGLKKHVWNPIAIIAWIDQTNTLKIASVSMKMPHCKTTGEERAILDADKRQLEEDTKEVSDTELAAWAGEMEEKTGCIFLNPRWCYRLFRDLKKKANDVDAED